MLHPRTFAFALLAGAFGLLAATMALNFALDPQYVFGTPLTRLDDNANYRYHRVREYQAQARSGRRIAVRLVARHGRSMLLFSRDKIGARAVAKFDVTAGMITDHLPALEYVLRDKARAAKRSKPRCC